MVLAKFRPGLLPEILLQKTYPYSQEMRNRILAAGEPDFSDGVEWLRLDAELGIEMGNLAKQFLVRVKEKGLKADLVASHGQTVRHLPSKSKYSLSLQIGDPARISAITNLPVVADFRRSDLAAGGQGAPLSPILHERLFRHDRKWRAIVNIGGISNATILPPVKSRSQPVAADCGPGNMAIDLATILLFGKPFDKHGGIAAKGRPWTQVIAQAFEHPYFKLPPPKSTGREFFGHTFLEPMMRGLRGARAEDIIATLTEITVRGIADFVYRFGRQVEEIYLCGGGAKNRYIVASLQKHLRRKTVATTAKLGYDPDYLEAMLWAYLAYCFVTQSPVTALRFTGAKKPYIPGRLCLP